MRRAMWHVLLLGCILGTFPACSITDVVEEVPSFRTQVGVASYYAHSLHGNLTANGERYNENDLTAAHKTLPFGTRVEVTNLANGRRVTLRINDRGPFVEGRIIDVSFRAAQSLDFVQQGLTQVEVKVLSSGS